MVVNLVQDVVDTQINLGNRDSITPVFRLFSEPVLANATSYSIITRSIGHAFTVGHATNGTIGTANGVDGQQITIGVAGLGASTLSRSG